MILKIKVFYMLQSLLFLFLKWAQISAIPLTSVSPKSIRQMASPKLMLSYIPRMVHMKGGKEIKRDHKLRMSSRYLD